MYPQESTWRSPDYIENDVNYFLFFFLFLFLFFRLVEFGDVDEMRPTHDGDEKKREIYFEQPKMISFFYLCAVLCVITVFCVMARVIKSLTG